MNPVQDMGLQARGSNKSLYKISVCDTGSDARIFYVSSSTIFRAMEIAIQEAAVSTVPSNIALGTIMEWSITASPVENAKFLEG
jgi:hypothetical protein